MFLGVLDRLFQTISRNTPRSSEESIDELQDNQLRNKYGVPVGNSMRIANLRWKTKPSFCILPMFIITELEKPVQSTSNCTSTFKMRHQEMVF